MRSVGFAVGAIAQFTNVINKGIRVVPQLHRPVGQISQGRADRGTEDHQQPIHDDFSPFPGVPPPPAPDVSSGVPSRPT